MAIPGLQIGGRLGKPLVMPFEGTCGDGLSVGARSLGLQVMGRSGKPLIAYAPALCGDNGELENGKEYLGVQVGGRLGKPLVLGYCKTCEEMYSSSSVGIRRPNGCASCEGCCPDVCWWYTTWHKSLSASSFVVATGVVSPDWTLTGYSLSNVGGDPDYLYLGSIGGGQIGGVTAINNAGDITSDVPPNPYWVGTFTYSDGVDTMVVSVAFSLTFTLPCPCGEYADSLVWSGTVISDPMPPGTVDYIPMPNDVIGGSGIMVDCGGTIAIDGAGVSMPSLTIVPMR